MFAWPPPRPSPRFPARERRERERDFIDNQKMTEGRSAQRPLGSHEITFSVIMSRVSFGTPCWVTLPLERERERERERELAGCCGEEWI